MGPLFKPKAAALGDGAIASITRIFEKESEGKTDKNVDYIGLCFRAMP